MPRELIWWTLENKSASKRDIDVIKDMYERQSISVGTIARETYEFPVIVGLHQGFTLSPYLFTLVIVN